MTYAEQARLTADWATILQSECAGLAVDREVQEALRRAAAHMAQQAALLHAWPPGSAAPGTGDDPPGPARADAPPRAAALDAAPGAPGTAIPAGGPGGVAFAQGRAPGLG